MSCIASSKRYLGVNNEYFNYIEPQFLELNGSQVRGPPWNINNFNYVLVRILIQHPLFISDYLVGCVKNVFCPVLYSN